MTFIMILHHSKECPRTLTVVMGALIAVCLKPDFEKSSVYRRLYMTSARQARTHSFRAYNPELLLPARHFSSTSVCKHPGTSYQIVISVFRLEHARDILQIVQIGLLRAGLREGHGDDALCHIRQVKFIAFLHLCRKTQHGHHVKVKLDVDDCKVYNQKYNYIFLATSVDAYVWACCKTSHNSYKSNKLNIATKVMFTPLYTPALLIHIFFFSVL